MHRPTTRRLTTVTTTKAADQPSPMVTLEHWVQRVVKVWTDQAVPTAAQRQLLTTLLCDIVAAAVAGSTITDTPPTSYANRSIHARQRV